MDNKKEIMDEKMRLNELKTLKSSYDMYERAKKDAIKRRTTAKTPTGELMYSEEKTQETLELMNTMQKDVMDRYEFLGGKIEELTKDIGNEEGRYGVYPKDEEYTDNEEVRKDKNVNDATDNVLEYLSKIQKTFDEKNNIHKVETPTKDNFDLSKIKEQYDSIPLPSKGECYSNKIGKVPVGYLTAYDENIIVSPNLYRDGTFLDYLLKSKILNPAIDPEKLLPGDRDAIILWLRATGYGNEFPVTVTDEETGKEFNATIDLSEIDYKEFKLVGDKNGWFKFTLPVSKDEVKFSFLTYAELRQLNEIEEMEDIAMKREEVKAISDKIMRFKKTDLAKTVNKQFGKRIDEAVRILDDWYDMITVEDEVKISHSLTNRLITSVKEINGITDKKYISEYIAKMNLKDSAALRKYITENEPGLDFEITVKKPKSLGGGSMKTFLKLDQFIFLNIA